MNSNHLGHSIWSMAAISWMPYQILGHRISPLVFKPMCIKKNGDKNGNKNASNGKKDG